MKQAAVGLIAKQAEGSAFTLTDLTNMGFNTDVVNALKEYVAHNKPFVKASAVMGNEGLLKIVVGTLERSSSRNFANFNSREEAMEWLAKQ